MNKNTLRFGQLVFYILLFSVSLLFTGHLSTGYLLLKRVALNFLLILLLFLWGRDFFSKQTTELAISPLLKPIILLILAGLVSFFGAVNPFEGIELWLQWADAGMLIFLVANYLDRETIKRSIYLLIGAGYVIAIYGICQDRGLDWVAHIAPHTPFSTFGNVNWAAQFLVILCPLALVVLLSEKETKKQVFASLGLVLLLIHLSLTRSRGGLLAVLGSSVFIIYQIFISLKQKTPLLSSQAFKKIIIIFGAMVIFLAFIFLSKPATREQFLFSSNNTRLLIWQSALKIWIDHPLLGVGLGNFKIFYPRYRFAEERQITSRDIQVDQTHNEYLQFLTDMGIVGFIAFLYFLLKLFQVSYHSLQQRENPDYFLFLGFIGAILGVLIDSLVCFPLQNPASLFCFILLAAFLTNLSSQDTIVKVTPTSLHRFLFNTVLLSFLMFSIFFQFKQIASDYWFTKGQYANNADNSVLYFNNSVLNYPFNFRSWLMLGYAQNMAYNYQEAAKAYEKANRLCPNYYLGHYYLGNVYLRLKRFQEAIAEFDASLALVPDYQLALSAKDDVQRQKVSSSLASEIPSLADTLSSSPIPDNIREKIEKAENYERAEEYQKAIAEYQTAYEIDPSLVMVKYRLGMLYLFLNQLDEAFPCFKEVAESKAMLPEPLRADTLSQMGHIHFLKNNFAPAEELFKQAINIDPRSYTAKYRLGMLYLQINQLDKAFSCFKEVTETKDFPPPARANALSQIGYIYFIKNNFSQAEELFKQAIDVNPQSLQGYQFLGNLYYSQNRKKEALAAWQKALAIFPQNPALSQNVQKLTQDLAKNEK